MKRVKSILQMLGGLGLILGVGAVLIIGFAGLSYGVRYVWSLFPFGVAGLFLGSAVILLVWYVPRKLFPESAAEDEPKPPAGTGGPVLLGYLYGASIILASVLWFFLPVSLLGHLPSFGSALGYSLVALLLLYGTGGCLTAAVEMFGDYLPGTLFFLACGLFGLFIVNSPVWSVTEGLPADYYLFGKIFHAAFVLLQLLYLWFFHLVPARSRRRSAARERTREKAGRR